HVVRGTIARSIPTNPCSPLRKGEHGIATSCSETCDFLRFASAGESAQIKRYFADWLSAWSKKKRVRTSWVRASLSVAPANAGAQCLTLQRNEDAGTRRSPGGRGRESKRL